MDQNDQPPSRKVKAPFVFSYSPGDKWGEKGGDKAQQQTKRRSWADK